MKDKYIILALLIAICVAVFSACSDLEEDTSIPDPGFAIICEYRDRFGRTTPLKNARVRGRLSQPLFGVSSPIFGATGTKSEFEESVVTGFGRIRVVDGIAPSPWSLTGVTGWSRFYGRYPSCDGKVAHLSIERGMDNYMTCQELTAGGGFGGLLPFPFSSMNVSESAIEFKMNGEGINSTNGMPIFQFYDAYGTLVAQTTATSIDTQDGLWAAGWTHCLAGLPTGTYVVEMWSPTSDGVGTLVNTSFTYLYGASSANYIDDDRYFVAQHYRDFLRREPGAGPDNGSLSGLDFWTSQITQCSQASFRQPNETYALCVVRKRVDVSRAFWYADEFLQYHPGLRNPAGTAPDFNNQEFARLCQVIYMGRASTQEESDYWANYLDANGDYNNPIKAFIYSDEYRARFEPPPPPTCNPSSYEVSNCQYDGGWWDYTNCYCVGGGGTYY